MSTAIADIADTLEAPGVSTMSHNELAALLARGTGEKDRLLNSLVMLEEATAKRATAAPSPVEEACWAAH